MYINQAFFELNKYSPKNILHIGGHIGEEGEIYKQMGANVLFVEPVPEYAEIIKKNGFDVLNVAVGKESCNIEMRVAGMFSSTMKRIRDFGCEAEWLKENTPYNITVKMIRLEDIDGSFDTLVVDTEGNVLDVLMSDNLNRFKTIIAEESGDLLPNFEGEPHNGEIEKYLNSVGFKKVAKFQNNGIYRKV